MFALVEATPHRGVAFRWVRIPLINKMDRCSHPYRMRPTIHGFSHGLKTCSPQHVFTPVCALVPPFRIHSHPLPIKRPTTSWSVFLLAEDEGFEPPQTESESGVLPLHKSSMCLARILLYAKGEKSQEVFSCFCRNFCFSPGIG